MQRKHQIKKFAISILALCAIAFLLNASLSAQTLQDQRRVSGLVSGGSGSVVCVAGSTQKICQLTGEFDLERQQNTINLTGSHYKLKGTDLGAPFEYMGRIYFLFGDTHPTDGNNNFRPPVGDAIAFTEDKNPEDCISLQFVTAPDGGYLSPKVPNISLREYEVPAGGFSANGKMYVFFTTDWDTTQKIMGRSILARSDDYAQSDFHFLYNVSTEKFINISPCIVNNADIPELQDNSGQGLLLWSSGRYRKSDPYLAYVPLDSVENRAAWRYYAGTDPGTGKPKWSNSEFDADSLFAQPKPGIGELSVTWNPFLHKWLMVYTSGEPRGILFRVADRPWGPWSPVGVLFEPWIDNGYCHFMHVNWDSSHTDGAWGKKCDNVYDSMFGKSREREWGGEYGAYVISNYTTGDATSTTIYYLMSTWNPYQVVLMKSTLQFGDVWLAGDFWVDFNYGGITKNGTFDFPYNTITDGVNNIPAGRTLKIKTGSRKETISITKKMKIEAFGGTATIGR